jgi:zinc protease
VVELVRAVEPPGNLSLPLNAVTVESVDGLDMTADVVRTGAKNLANALLLLAMRLKVTDQLDWSVVLQRDDDGFSRPLTPRVGPHVEASLRLQRALYGAHPYGRLSAPSEIRRVKPEEVEEWLLRMRRPRNGVLVIAGDVDPAEGERLVRAWLGGWRDQPKIALPSVPAVPAPGPGAGAAKEAVIITPRPGVPQVEIAVACRLPAAQGRAAAAQSLMAGVIGGYLYTRLRAEAGAAYGVSGRVHALAGGARHMLLETTVDTGRLADVLKSLRGHWRKFGDGGFDEGALSQVRWRAAVSANLAYQTSTELALDVLGALVRGEPIDRLARHREDVMAVTPADLAAAFAPCRGSTVISLLGDEGAIGAAVAAAGL